jgi:hypothetical protein
MPYAFSDGSILFEFAAFSATFIICMVAIYGSTHFWSGATIANYATSFSGFLQARLFTVSNPIVEQRRLDLLRILLGSFVSSKFRKF